MKITTIIENNPITGVKYGEVEIPETPRIVDVKHAARTVQKISERKNAKIRAEHTKQK